MARDCAGSLDGRKQVEAQGRKSLTPRQSEVLAAIASFIDSHGYSPTVRELGPMCGISSSRSVHVHIMTLERKGYIYHISGRMRTMRLKTAPPGRESVRVIGGMLSSFRGFNRVQIEGKKYVGDAGAGDVAVVMSFDLLKRLGMADEESGTVRPGRLWFEADATVGPGGQVGHVGQRGQQ